MITRILLARLRTFATIKDEFDNIFGTDMLKLMRMHHRLHIEDRFAEVPSNLFEHLDDHNLHQEATNAHGEIGLGS